MAYVDEIIERVERENPAQPEFHQAVRDVLESLPAYQKKCTALDALCQAIESYWSVYSTDESKGYVMRSYTMRDFAFHPDENYFRRIDIPCVLKQLLGKLSAAFTYA